MATVSAVSTTDRFYFSKEQLQNTPSRKNGVDPEKEQSYRQQAATLIQDMGQRLSVSQLTINTAIVYMHRFYMFHSFNKFHRNSLAPCCLFLAAKIEEQPRKLEHVIKVAHACLHRDGPPLDLKSEEYLQQAQDLVENESILLQTLGFEITVHHPHTYVVKCIQLVRASKDLGQTSYFMATNSLHLTTLCLQYKPPVVACACIHLASKWSNWEIPRSNDGKDWWEYIDSSVSKSMLDDIAQDFLKVMEKCPNRLKRKISSVTNLKGVGKVSKGESSKTNNGAGTLNLSSMSAVHNSLDVAHNGYASYDGSYFTNDIEIKVLHKQKPEKEKERDREKRKESSSLGKLKPLPVSSTATASSGASSSAGTTAMPPLPPLPPLTSKYATVTTASQLPASDAKISTSTAHSTSGTSLSTTKDPLSSRGKHRHHHQDDSQPAKKHKSSHAHSQRSHSSSHRRPSASSQSSDSSPTKGIKHSHSSSSLHKSSSGHAVKPSHLPLPHSQTGHSSSQAALSSSHSHSSKKPHHPSSHHTPSSHKLPSHHGHGHSSSHKSSSAAASSKKHLSSSKPPAMVIPSQPVARPMTPPPPPPPPPTGIDFSVLSSLNTPGALGGFLNAEIQPPFAPPQFPPQFLQPAFQASLMPGMMPGMMHGMVPPPPPPEPEPSSPPPPPPPPLP
ncbi:Cyclin-T2 [Desmophyllum pertusum]|uniref:Cyclin-T2 n=1 Tax=Desmophyllum pertusum TaxID=174260 RepID=A0A9W9Z5J0_9CNID|nr:Cyclin-T2 [Desmophyllum pertusum]